LESFFRIVSCSVSFAIFVIADIMLVFHTLIIPPFIYKHLPLLEPRSSRLVDLASGSYDEPILCTFSTFQVDHPPGYEAVSYTWGDPTPSHYVEVGSSRLPINANLDLALRRLRRRDIKRRLWVDAICIDQYNVKERQIQVRHMCNIYRGAQRVVVYLGEEADGSEQMPELFRAMAYIRALIKSSEANPNAKLEHSDHTSDVTPCLAGSSAWAAARAFYGRPWMRRVWVIQGMVVAKDLVFVCGNWQLPREIIEEAVYASIELPHMDPYTGSTMDDRKEGLNQLFRMLVMTTEATVQSSGSDLIDLLVLIFNTKASDPRDHLYGILVLSHEAQAPDLRPDYTEPWYDTYRRYTEYFIKRGHGLKILYKSSSDTASPFKRSGILPSWVPDWSFFEGSQSGGLINGYGETDKGLAAANQVLSSMSVGDDCALYISGKIVDKIIRLTSRRDQQEDFSHCLVEHVAEPGIFNNNPQQGTTSVNNKDIFLHAQALWKAEMEYLAQSNEESNVGRNSNDLMFSTMLCDREFDTEVILTEPSSPSNRENRDILMHIDGNWSKNRRCLTSACLVGQIPIDTAEGDLVAIFMGAAVPFIIRPIKEGYQLIGQAYFHALMRGEALEPSFGPSQIIKLV
jgi:hypothetical protein